MWRERINRVLTKATGYELQASAADAEQGSEDVAVPSPTGSGAARKGKLPGHYDNAAKAIINRVNPRTMTNHTKLFGLILATRYVAQHQIPGEIVECGVWRGGSMQAVALTLLEAGVTDRELHLFDTFEGMPPPTSKDVRHDGVSAAELLETRDRTKAVWAIATLEDVRTGMAELDYPPERIHFHEGMVETTIPAECPEQIALLRLDTDWYESTRHELEHMYARLSPGGVLIIDDYGHWEGSRRAVDEFMTRTGAPLLLLPLASGRIGVKPGL
jgi:O-methyltransferase